ncbi:hypothetical protein HYG87_10685 [Methanobacterium alkalithermotolerans]|uniref:Uncharacterized protein n=1 Tax=Methanobacterium alkalithermotolerans TaxID=2731220 RepID=A0A8T8K8E5_9EURY|nr:hypothetical protein [Methanobacterium alkalithermotolerans]QUH24189.1 hypothetical protein HYG87_10685 [Methanobacterium alkalithermotolerans]
MTEEKIEKGLGRPALSNDWPLENKNLLESNNLMAVLPEKLETKIPEFRKKVVKLLPGGCSLFFMDINGLEYYLSIEISGKSYLLQWVEIDGHKPLKFHRKVSSRSSPDIESKNRDKALVKYLNNHTGIPREKIREFLNEAGIFIENNRGLLNNETDFALENPEEDAQKDPGSKEELSEERRNELIEILSRPDLLSYIDEALYERPPNKGFIIGEVESKHTLNFNCIGARLGLSTINTLKGESSIGKTNTANVVTGLHRIKKVGSLSDTALKYADDLDQVDIIYIQETLEEEFNNKQTRLMSADDGGFVAETTIKNPKTGQFEVQKTVIPVKTLVTTTTAIELDPEFASRNFIIPVDDSEEQTKRILEENFKTTEKTLQEIKGEMNFDYKYKNLKDAFQLLKEYIVLIPFESELLDIFPTNNPRARRDSKKLMQLIKESALLFQYQRCRAKLNEKPVLVASWIDLAHSIILGGPILEATLTGFDKRLLEALPVTYQLIEDNGYVTTKSLQKKLKKSNKYAYRILKFFEDNGYIYHDHDTKIAEGIKGKVNVYIKTGAREYKSLLLSIRNIDWLNIKEREEKFIKTQIPNSSHQIGEILYLPEYDPRVHNKVVYKPTSISSEEFELCKNKTTETKKQDQKDSLLIKSKKSNPEMDKIVEQNFSAEIDYRNLTLVEKAIISELASLRKFTTRSLVEELRSDFSKEEIILALEDMDKKGWLA